MARVLTWNVAGRVRSAGRQAGALAEQPADVVALQEIRLTSLAAWRGALAELGFTHIATSFDAYDPGLPQAPERRLGVLIAARSPLEPLEPPALPWPERLLGVRTVLDGEPVDIWNLHAPLSSKPGQVKVATLEAVCEHLAPSSDVPRVLVGDLNTPQYESREGEVQTFARTRSGRIRPGYGERHDEAELALIVTLREHGYEDAFRTLHGYMRRDRSYVFMNGRVGWRLDHVIVRGLRIAGCDYVHDWRERKLSDHSAMWADLRP
jgi:endonuclease/exonuclease/phosphatase family metal-dependent hydrolase